jgi:hypothetical protein
MGQDHLMAVPEKMRHLLHRRAHGGALILVGAPGRRDGITAYRDENQTPSTALLHIHSRKEERLPESRAAPDLLQSRYRWERLHQRDQLRMLSTLGCNAQR